jgi:hypothetical protein
MEMTSRASLIALARSFVAAKSVSEQVSLGAQVWRLQTSDKLRLAALLLDAGKPTTACHCAKQAIKEIEFALFDRKAHTRTEDEKADA